MGPMERSGPAKVKNKRRKDMEKAIEDAVSDAMSDDDKNPTSLKNTLKGRNRKREPSPGRFNKNYNETPDIPKDPGGGFGFRNRILGSDGRGASGSKLGVGASRGGYGTGVGDPQTGLTRGRQTAKNAGHQTFAMGGEVDVRPGDVRDNPKRGKCY